MNGVRPKTIPPANACRNVPLRRSVRHGFTLVELLVVIAIIGILIALLLPAVQAAREAARRAQCSNNLKQLGLGLLNYEAATGALPCPSVVYIRANLTAGTGGRAFSRQGWFVAILPFIEQGGIYSQYNTTLSLNSRGNANWCGTTNALITPANPNPPLAQPITTIQCPSDGLATPTRDYGPALAGPAQCGVTAAGNYMAFTGNYSYYYQLPLGAGDRKPAVGVTLNPPFYLAAFAPARWIGIREISDGTSNTMLLGEYLQGLPTTEQPQDERGWIYSDEPTSSTIDTANTPNSGVKDKMYPNSCDDGTLIGNRPDLNLPCSNLSSTISGDESASSRSRHIGGVFVVFGDGSVKFMSNNIALATWQSLGGINEGNPISAY